MLWAGGCRAGSCRAPRKAHKFGRCLGGRGAAIAHTKTGGAGRARGAASAAKPGSTAATACITGAETAALRGIVFPVEVAAAGAAAEAAGIAAPAGRAGVARGPAGNGITVTGTPAHGRTAFQRRAAGLFYILRLDLAQEAAGFVALGAAVEHPGDAVGDIQLLLGAGDADIGQTALFLQICLGVFAHLAGEHPLLHANEEHIGEFQTLCRVDGHQDHLVSALVVAVNVADKGDILQIAFQ